MAEFKAANSASLECTITFNYLYHFKLFIMFQIYKIVYIYLILLEADIETDNMVSVCQVL